MISIIVIIKLPLVYQSSRPGDLRGDNHLKNYDSSTSHFLLRESTYIS